MAETVDQAVQGIKLEGENDKKLLSSEAQDLEKIKQDLETQTKLLRKESKVVKDPLLVEVEKKLEEVKEKLGKKTSSNAGLYNESDNFNELKVDVDKELKKIKDGLEDTTKTLLRQLDVVGVSLKTDVQGLKQRVGTDLEYISAKTALNGGGDLDKDLSAIQEKLKLLKEGKTQSGTPEDPKAAVEKELKEVKDQINTTQQQKEKLEQDLQQIKLKKDLGSSSSSSIGSGPSPSEIEALRKQLSDEEKEKGSIATEIAELKEKIKKLAPARATSSTSLDSSSGVRSLINEKSLEINFSDIKIVKKLSSGPFSEVHEGILNEERVAVKKLTSTGNDALKDFERELQIMCNSHSGYIVPLYGYNLHPPNMCLIMEYFPRRDLGTLLADKNVFLPWERRWHLARDAALAINYLHSRSPPILHRDIKSFNFLISFDWKLKLADFGAAIFKGTETSSAFPEEALVGWTAPEILLGEAYTEKADVYSYSSVLYELATRKLPWEEWQKPEEQKLIKVALIEGKRPTVPPEVSDDFRRLIEQGWEEAGRRPNMGTVLKTFNRKGLLDTASIQESNDNWQEEKGKLKEELALHSQLRENAENRCTEAEKELERERRKRADVETKVNDLESKYETEKNNARNLEKLRIDRERELTQEKIKASDATKKQEDFDKKYKQEKRKNEKFVKQKEEAEASIEEISKKYEQEKKKRLELQKELMNLGVSTT
eukprot:TRINITY_DN4843_c0_g3_i3.p1 TRINITY_DN4843_c0_g3~~TRINITY_DN4843_c0_g3_i3.p1  ORF type:complete len:715 (-),score=294.92 TRINITY_DN4843_c0_g3_i3:216-2360(-)